MKNPKNATPSEIVKYLDEYIIGQNGAKKTIALALRTRYRRIQLPQELQDEVMPKNILMIGSTGVGKTEIARRLAKIMGFPFVKVEASKYTEVGFVGRDVESMVRDLVSFSMNMVREELEEQSIEAIGDYILEKIVDKLLPKPPKLSPNGSEEKYKEARQRMMDRVLSGEMDDKKIEIDIKKSSNPFGGEDGGGPVEIMKIQESLSSVFDTLGGKKEKREVTVKEAKNLLKLKLLRLFLIKRLLRERGFDELKMKELSLLMRSIKLLLVVAVRLDKIQVKRVFREIYSQLLKVVQSTQNLVELRVITFYLSLLELSILANRVI